MGDIVASAYRVRGRVNRRGQSSPPLLDHRIVEFAWALPRRFKIRGGESKGLLRRVAERMGPRPLLERPKMGFGIPLADWLRGPLRDWAEDLLDAKSMEADGLLVSKEDLVSRVWPDVVVSEENLKVQVSALRRALGADRDVIRTEFGRGYRFTGVLCSSAAVGGCQRPSRAKRRSAPTLPTHASGDGGTRPQNRWQSFGCSFGWS